jgi:TonB family protein
LSLSSFRFEKRHRPLVVDYIILKEIEKAVAKKTAETPRVEINKVVETKDESAPKPQRAPAKAESQDQLKQEAKKADNVREALAERLKKETKLKSTRDYISYYSLLRERVRRRLKENYRNYAKEGDVYLTFGLSADGTLLTLNIDDARSSADIVLRDMALKSLKEASPFPRFPKGLTVPKMSFSVLISFRRN